MPSPTLRLSDSSPQRSSRRSPPLPDDSEDPCMPHGAEPSKGVLPAAQVEPRRSPTPVCPGIQVCQTEVWQPALTRAVGVCPTPGGPRALSNPLEAMPRGGGHVQPTHTSGESDPASRLAPMPTDLPPPVIPQQSLEGGHPHYRTGEGGPTPIELGIPGVLPDVSGLTPSHEASVARNGGGLGNLIIPPPEAFGNRPGCFGNGSFQL